MQLRRPHRTTKMYIQMLATRVKAVKQIRAGCKHIYYIIVLTGKLKKVNKDLEVLITMHFHSKVKF